MSNVPWQTTFQHRKNVDQIRNLIDSATNDRLLAPDIATNMKLVDLAKSDKGICREVVRQCRKRLIANLRSKNGAELTLKLIETLSTNASSTHMHFAKARNLDAVVLVAQDSPYIQVREQALKIISKWANTHEQNKYPIFMQVYQRLQKNGVVFPVEARSAAVNDHSVPAPTSNSFRENTEIAHKKLTSSDIEVMDPELCTESEKYKAMLMGDLQAMQENLNLAVELIQATKNAQQVRQSEPIAQLMAVVAEARVRLAQLLQELVDEDLLDFALSINFAMNAVQKFYNERCSGALTTVPVLTDYIPKQANNLKEESIQLPMSQQSPSIYHSQDMTDILNVSTLNTSNNIVPPIPVSYNSMINSSEMKSANDAEALAPYRGTVSLSNQLTPNDDLGSPPPYTPPSNQFFYSNEKKNHFDDPSSIENVLPHETLGISSIDDPFYGLDINPPNQEPAVASSSRQRNLPDENLFEM